MNIQQRRDTCAAWTLLHCRPVLLAMATFCMGWVSVGEPALAAFGPVARISNAGKRPNRGDALTVQSDWVDAPGYRQVRFQLDCTAPANADRTLTIEFYAQHWYGPALTTSFDLDVPAGSAQVVKELTVPQYYPWQMFQIRVSENGRENEELTGFSGGTSFGGQWQSHLPGILMVGEWPGTDLSSFAAMAGMAGAYTQNPNVLAPTTPGVPVTAPTAMNFTTTNLHAMPATGLPKDWKVYTGLDIVCFSLGELEKLKNDNPEAWAAVRNWTAAGGNLWIHGVENPSKQTKVDELLDMPAAWKDARLTSVEQQWRATAGNVGHGIEAGAFSQRDFQLGRIVAIKKDLLQIPGTNTWQVVRDEMGMDRTLWHRRYGTTMDQNNGDFWNFLIPGVGLAPVNTYRLLITLFVIAIGPINYGLLYRFRRLHLLMFTVPASAVVVAAALVGYALAADGIETRVRARTFTQIDQRRGEAITNARLSYYAALAPSAGLVFPSDTALFPIEASGHMYHGRNRGERRFLSLVDDEQRLTRGWLNSRTPTQYVATRISPSDLKLEISKSGDSVNVVNRLGAVIKQLLLFDEQGNRHQGSDIEPDATATLKPITANQVANDQPPFDSMHQEYLNTMPRDTRAYSPRYYPQQAYVITPGMEDTPDRITTASSRLEAGIQEHLQTPGQRVRPRSYVAIVEHNPHLPLGLDSAAESPEETGSFHVIVGYW